MRVTRIILAMLVVSAISATAADRPNVLFIMSDDHAAHAISAYGSRLAEVAPTPNIDRLANEGALFTNAFCTNSICSPSRACVLTGQYNHINGSFDLAGSVSPGKQMLAIQMKKAGYQTAMIGKWHLKDEQPISTITAFFQDRASITIRSSEFGATKRGGKTSSSLMASTSPMPSQI